MNSFIAKINEVRDILRKDGITGMDSITHCVAFYILRNLTNDLCIKLDIPEHFSYDKFNKDENGTLLCKDKLFEKFYKQRSTECFVYVLVNKFNFKPIKNFAIKTSLYLEKIFKCFETINPEQLNIDCDIVGTIYEIHLATGATGQGMRDLGQYFTHRKVIKYMVELCDPKVKSDGSIETILDPSMGTGGFLTMATKYLSANNSNINWEENQDNIYGFDVSENMQSLAHINLLLENNEIFENIKIQDTLHGDFEVNDVIIDKYDVILANEPFGLKNIVHAECCERIVDLRIRGTKAEPLYLQLMMISLNENGRCAVIVPDGVLFNDSKLHKDTRKYLIENLNLKKIITMEGEFFMNTAVKSSILYFVNDGITTNVEFCKINIINDEIVEEIIKTITREDIIRNNYSLFINKYMQTISVQINNIEYKKLGDMCVFLPKSKRKASFGSDIGLYPFYTSSMTSKLCDIADYNVESIIIGTGGNASVKISSHYSCSADNFIIKITNGNTKYIYYWLLKNIQEIEALFHGTTIKHLGKTDLENIKIPIPSLEIQQDIVNQCDQHVTSINTLRTQIKDIERQNPIENILSALAIDQ